VAERYPGAEALGELERLIRVFAFHGPLLEALERARGALAEESAELTAEWRDRVARAEDALVGMAATEREVAKYREALERIKREEGKVCQNFELCSHPACNSSYSAWAIADEALNPTGRDER
jgi:hypothetical protein